MKKYDTCQDYFGVKTKGFAAKRKRLRNWRKTQKSGFEEFRDMIF